MFVPDMWGHEIFNLEPTVGVQAMYTTGDASGAARVAGGDTAWGDFDKAQRHRVV